MVKLVLAPTANDATEQLTAAPAAVQPGDGWKVASAGCVSLTTTPVAIKGPQVRHGQYVTCRNTNTSSTGGSAAGQLQLRASNRGCVFIHAGNGDSAARVDNTGEREARRGLREGLLRIQAPQPCQHARNVGRSLGRDDLRDSRSCDVRPWRQQCENGCHVGKSRNLVCHRTAIRAPDTVVVDRAENCRVVDRTYGNEITTNVVPAPVAPALATAGCCISARSLSVATASTRRSS